MQLLKVEAKGGFQTIKNSCLNTPLISILCLVFTSNKGGLILTPGLQSQEKNVATNNYGICTCVAAIVNNYLYVPYFNTCIILISRAISLVNMLQRLIATYLIY